MEKNWTTGSCLKNIFMFAVPFFFSILLQTLYGIADLFITGQFNGTECITAVSNGSQVMHMLTLAITGLAVGPTITIGKAIGSSDKEKVSEAIGNSVTLFMTGAVILMVILLFLTGPIIHLIKTPPEAAADAVSYLKICFIGIPFITAYNLISAIFRGLGDSKTPMYFITIAFLCNIGLDYLFIGAFGLGTAGAALGTTIAQAVSVFSALYVVLKKETGIHVVKKDFRLHKEMTRMILKIGVPVFLQNTFIQVAFMSVTVFVNMRGLIDAAAVGIVEKLIGIMFLVPSTMVSTVSALAAQNLGAQKTDRAKKTMWDAIAICVIFGFIISIFTITFSRQIIGLFEENEAVITAGMSYMKSYVWDCIFAGIHFCFSGYFCALERSELSFLHNFFAIILIRIPFAYLTAKYFLDSLFPLGLVTTFASLFSAVFCYIAYLIITKKQNRLTL